MLRGARDERRRGAEVEREQVVAQRWPAAAPREVAQHAEMRMAVPGQEKLAPHRRLLYRPTRLLAVLRLEPTQHVEREHGEEADYHGNVVGADRDGNADGTRRPERCRGRGAVHR